MIGIDPGQTGALAAIHNGNLSVIDMPMTDGSVDGGHIFQWICSWDDYRQHDGPVVWIEDVHSMPKQGVSSVFKFGKSFGITIGAVQSSRASINYARPQDWKAHFGLLGTGKNGSLVLARELFPERTDLFRLKKHDGRAEAALIALYGLEHTPK